MASLACRHLVHPAICIWICLYSGGISGSRFQGRPWVQPTLNEITATRLLAPTHFVKMDQGILPVADYLHIDPIERSGVSILLNPYTGIQQGGKWKDTCLVNIVLRG